MKKNIYEIQNIIKYEFKNKDLLAKALMHSSYTNEKHLQKHESNERLEFLGDAVLELISSEFLFQNNHRMPEGELTKNRASMVCEQSLAYCAREIKIGEFLLLGKGEEVTGGRNRDSITSDALEALIGAIYLDGGFANAKEFIYNFILNDLDKKKLFYDSKTILQELVQGNFSDGIKYVLTGESGPDHNKSFEVDVMLGANVLGRGVGRTKKLAEQNAAYQAILALNKRKK
ncbi:MAG: ribonuclease III [Eubacteriales bacterium]